MILKYLKTKYYFQLALLLFFSFLVASCAVSMPDNFPRTDIVFQASDFNVTELGFINADGTDEERVPLEFYVSRPLWSSNGEELFFIHVVGDRSIGEDDQIASSREGERVHVCRNRRLNIVDSIETIIDLTDRPVLLVDNASEELLIIDPAKCKIRDRLVNFVDDETKVITGASASDDGNLIVYSVRSGLLPDDYKYIIKSLDLSSNATVDLVEGINPRLSPSLKQIAYVWFDGIYIYDMETAETRRVVSLDARWEISDSLVFQTAAPVPRWSPTGDKLIYHKCIRRNRFCEDISDYDIFVLDVSTGIENRLVEGGVYPYWR